jgi:hypothetical protein
MLVLSSPAQNYFFRGLDDEQDQKGLANIKTLNLDRPGHKKGT